MGWHRKMPDRTQRIATIRMITAILSLGIWTVFAPAIFAQERSQGISIHLLPKRVAAIGGTPWGLAVDASPRLNRAAARPIFQTAAGLISYVRAQDPDVQLNGIWIVTTHPDAYSEEEKGLLEEVKAICRKENIPLFLCRASQLPNGWIRSD